MSKISFKVPFSSRIAALVACVGLAAATFLSHAPAAKASAAPPPPAETIGFDSFSVELTRFNGTKCSALYPAALPNVSLTYSEGYTYSAVSQSCGDVRLDYTFAGLGSSVKSTTGFPDAVLVSVTLVLYKKNSNGTWSEANRQSAWGIYDATGSAWKYWTGQYLSVSSGSGYGRVNWRAKAREEYAY